MLRLRMVDEFNYPSVPYPAVRMEDWPENPC